MKSVYVSLCYEFSCLCCNACPGVNNMIYLVNGGSKARQWWPCFFYFFLSTDSSNGKPLSFYVSEHFHAGDKTKKIIMFEKVTKMIHFLEETICEVDVFTFRTL